MADNKTPWLTYALLAGGAYVAYRLYQNYAAGATPAATAASTVVPSLPAPGGQTLADQVLAPVPSQQLPVSTISPSVVNNINNNGVVLDPAAYNWILSHTTPWYTEFFTYVFPQWSQEDVTILDQILVQYNVGATLTGQLLSFWNQWFPNGYPAG